MARKDSDIRADVLAEMAWDPKVTVADIGATVKDGYVTLTGVASTFATKYAATDAAFRVYGVKDVDNDMIVDPAAFGLRTDEQIAADVRSMLALDLEVPDTRITVSVLDGVVTLGGDVDYFYQRDAAEDDAASILGVRDVIANIAVLEQAVGPRYRRPDCGRVCAQRRAVRRQHQRYDQRAQRDPQRHGAVLERVRRGRGRRLACAGCDVRHQQRRRDLLSVAVSGTAAAVRAPLNT